MNKKIFWGIILIIIGLFYTLQQYIPESVLKYIFNYQVIILIIGLWNFVKKNKTLGTVLTVSALYLYLREFFNEYFELTLPIIILLGGVIVLLLGILEKGKISKKEFERPSFIFKSTKKSEDKVEDAEEVK